jgi:hypothetical protein
MSTDGRASEDRQPSTERHDDGAQRLQSLIEAGRKLDAVLRQSVSASYRLVID